MRNFQTLDTVKIDGGVIYMMDKNDLDEDPSMLVMQREGTYMAISASHGPFEIALRPRAEDFTRLFAHLHPVDGLQTTRQVGTAQAYIAVGLSADGGLLVRPTIVADATGHLSFNLILTPEVRKALFKWLAIAPE